MKSRILTSLLLTVAALASCSPGYEEPRAAQVPQAPYSVYSEGLIADITPRGWLEEVLRRQKNGLTGHPEAMDYPYNSVLWAGELERYSDSRGADWWRFEQTAYYLDGLTRLGYLTDDPELLKVWNENLEYVLAHPLPFKKGQTPSQKELDAAGDFIAQISADPKATQYQKFKAGRALRVLQAGSADRPEGRLGAEAESMAWPFAVFFRAFKACYEATGDSRIPQALLKHYRTYTDAELSLSRFVVNVEGMLWTYSLTGEEELLNRSKWVWDNAFAELTPALCSDDSRLNLHGVTMNEMLKIPLLLYEYTGEQSYFDQAMNAFRKMEVPNMLVDGVVSSTEFLAGNHPLASHETCDISDYCWTMGYFLQATGDAIWADRIEKCMFNAALGCITKDFKAMQYFSCPNQFIATGNSDHNSFKYGKTWMQYRPIHETECCIGNLHRYFPNYVARMWLKDNEGYPVAALYGPSEVVYDLGDGLSVKIEQDTAYPFEEAVTFRFTFFKDGRISREEHYMPFTYRVPEWCNAGELESGFHTEKRSWKSGDEFTVSLPMEVRFEDNPVQGRSITRGPIVYSFPIEALVQEDTLTYENLAGKKSANPDFKSWSMTPAADWNYALQNFEPEDVEVVFKRSSAFPFDPGCSPVTLRVKASKVQGWSLKEDRFTPALPSDVQIIDGSDTTLELVPYGSTTLRLTIFPVAP